MNTETISDSCMGFQLPDGKTFLIGKKDIDRIASDIFVEIMTKESYKVMILKDTGLERANKLYEVYLTEKSEMSEKQKQDCLKLIIKYLSDNNYELSTLNELMKQKKL